MMILEKKINAIRENEKIKKINAFLYSNWFIFAVAVLTIIGHFFAIELVIYGIFTCAALFIAVFGRDYLPYVPMIVACFTMPNAKNNPGRMEGSIFYMKNGGVAIVVMAVLLVIALLFRLSMDKEIGFKALFTTKRSLTFGVIALLGAYVLSGIGSKNFSTFAIKNILFGLLELVAMFVPYFLLTTMVKWDKVDKRYFAYTGIAMGLIVGIETLYCYATNGVVTNGEIDRLKIYAGWGINNNMGALIAMAIPFAFYFIHKGEKIILNSLLAVLFCFFAVMTCSRGAILASAGVYFVCSLFVFIKSKSKTARYTTFGCVMGLLLALWLIGGTKYDALAAAFKIGLSSNGRFKLYKLGLKVFTENPIFGSTFYAMNEYAVGENSFWMWSELTSFTGFMPARWHNTVVQLLASCGIVGLLAYGYHRIQTFKLFFKNVTAENVFIGFSVFVLLGLSLLDCHLFNLGPTLIYSCSLAFIEGFTKVKEIEKE